jgi:archaellum component FlaC
MNKEKILKKIDNEIERCELVINNRMKILWGTNSKLNKLVTNIQISEFHYWKKKSIVNEIQTIYYSDKILSNSRKMNDNLKRYKSFVEEYCNDNNIHLFKLI